jgi:hypothetical protein
MGEEMGLRGKGGVDVIERGLDVIEPPQRGVVILECAEGNSISDRETTKMACITQQRNSNLFTRRAKEILRRWCFRNAVCLFIRACPLCA